MNIPKTSIKVLARIERQLHLQNEKGLEKYGKNIDGANDEDYDWNVMVIEELIDGMQYLVKENQRLNEEIQRLGGRLYEEIKNK